MNDATCPSKKCCTHQLSSEKCSIQYASLSTIFNLLHSNMNQDLVKKQLYNQGSHCEKYRQFPLRMQRKPSHTISHQINTLAVSEDEWNTKEDTGKSMKNTYYILWYTKRHISADAMLNSEKIMLVAFAIIELCLSEGIS